MEEIKILRELMHEIINTYGIESEKALEVSQQLDILISKKQKKEYYRYYFVNRYISWYKADELMEAII